MNIAVISKLKSKNPEGIGIMACFLRQVEAELIVDERVECDFSGLIDL